MIRFVMLSIGIVALAVLVGCADPGVRPFWVLKNTDFRQLKADMSKPEVVAIVGKPHLATTFRRMGEEVWDYSYMDSQTHMRAFVYFDLKGIFKHHTEAYDQDYYNGGEGE